MLNKSSMASLRQTKCTCSQKLLAVYLSVDKLVTFSKISIESTNLELQVLYQNYLAF